MKHRKHEKAQSYDRMGYLVLFKDGTILPLVDKPNAKEIEQIFC